MSIQEGKEDAGTPQEGYSKIQNQSRCLIREYSTSLQISVAEIIEISSGGKVYTGPCCNRYRVDIPTQHRFDEQPGNQEETSSLGMWFMARHGISWWLRWQRICLKCRRPESGRSPGEGKGNPLQYSYLENPMDRGVWQATVHGVAKGSGTTQQLDNKIDCNNQRWLGVEAVRK